MTAATHAHTGISSLPSSNGSAADVGKFALCRFYFERGICDYGDTCKNAHDISDLKYGYKTRPCNFFTQGKCRNMQEYCGFTHGEQDEFVGKPPEPLRRSPSASRNGNGNGAAANGSLSGSANGDSHAASAAAAALLDPAARIIASQIAPMLERIASAQRAVVAAAASVAGPQNVSASPSSSSSNLADWSRPSLNEIRLAHESRETREANLAAEMLHWRSEAERWRGEAERQRGEAERLQVQGGGGTSLRVDEQHVAALSRAELEDLDRRLADASTRVRRALEARGPPCAVCSDRGAEVVYLPCRHLCLCGICDGLLSGTSGSGGECPLCNLPVSSRIPGIRLHAAH
eukprot:tig00000769_g4004.t2